MGVTIMIFVYAMGGILFTFGLLFLVESSFGTSTAPHIAYYPVIGTVLVIVAAAICYGGYRLGKSKPEAA